MTKKKNDAATCIQKFIYEHSVAGKTDVFTLNKLKYPIVKIAAGRGKWHYFNATHLYEYMTKTGKTSNPYSRVRFSAYELRVIAEKAGCDVKHMRLLITKASAASIEHDVNESLFEWLDACIWDPVRRVLQYIDNNVCQYTIIDDLIIRCFPEIYRCTVQSHSVFPNRTIESFARHIDDITMDPCIMHTDYCVLGNVLVDFLTEVYHSMQHL